MSRLKLVCAAALGFALLAARPVAASPPDSLTAQLRHGGYVLVMRHASSPLQPPEKNAAD